MENEVGNVTKITRANMDEVLSEFKNAIRHIAKGSKLRRHYIALSTINNIFRYYVVFYELEPKFKIAQEAFLKVLLDVEQRKSRLYMRSEIDVLNQTYDEFEILINSSTEQQFDEAVIHIKKHADESKYIVSFTKSFNSSRF